MRERERKREREREDTIHSVSHGNHREQEQSGVIHSANEMKRALEERLQQHLDSHQRQVDDLRAEIAAKEAHVSQVLSRYQEQMVTVSVLKEELEQTQQNYDQEKHKFAKIRTQMKVKERIRRDLGGLTDTVVGIYHVIFYEMVVGYLMFGNGR